MLIKRKRGWEIPERLATPEHLFDRRSVLRGTVAAAQLAAATRGAGTGLASLIESWLVRGPQRTSLRRNALPPAGDRRGRTGEDGTPPSGGGGTARPSGALPARRRPNGGS